MGLFDRFRPGRRGESDVAADQRHLREWAGQHTGVEAFVEPKTTVTPMTIVLVAADGEWTRRPADGPTGARRLGEQLGIPVRSEERRVGKECRL